MAYVTTSYRLGDTHHTLLKKILSAVNRSACPHVNTYTLATSTTPYADYDVLGGAVTLFTDTPGRHGHVLGATLVDPDNQGSHIELILLNGDLANPVTDNQPISWSSSDYNKIIGRLSISGVDYIRLGSDGPSVATVTGVYVPFEHVTKLVVVPVVMSIASYSANSLRLKVAWVD